MQFNADLKRHLLLFHNHTCAKILIAKTYLKCLHSPFDSCKGRQVQFSLERCDQQIFCLISSDVRKYLSIFLSNPVEIPKPSYISKNF